MIPLVWILLLFQHFSNVEAFEQSIGVAGFINCRGIRQPGIFVQLKEEDLFLFDADDLMAATNTDIKGSFTLIGTASELTEIEPYILIEHNCGHEGTDQKAQFTQYLSKEYLTFNGPARIVEHLGEIELLQKDAPIQFYEVPNYEYKHSQTMLQKRIDDCLLLYQSHKEYFEKKAFGGQIGTPYMIEQDPSGLGNHASLSTSRLSSIRGSGNFNGFKEFGLESSSDAAKKNKNKRKSSFLKNMLDMKEKVKDVVKKDMESGEEELVLKGENATKDEFFRENAYKREANLLMEKYEEDLYNLRMEYLMNLEHSQRRHSVRRMKFNNTQKEVEIGKAEPVNKPNHDQLEIQLEEADSAKLHPSVHTNVKPGEAASEKAIPNVQRGTKLEEAGPVTNPTKSQKEEKSGQVVSEPKEVAKERKIPKAVPEKNLQEEKQFDKESQEQNLKHVLEEDKLVIKKVDGESNYPQKDQQGTLLSEVKHTVSEIEEGHTNSGEEILI